MHDQSTACFCRCLPPLKPSTTEAFTPLLSLLLLSNVENISTSNALHFFHFVSGHFHSKCAILAASMLIRFSKYQGTGNDFIMIDNRAGEIDLTAPQIIQLCDRKFGVGADGIILIEETDFSDFYMNFYNPDGSQSFCGNGSRCAVRFAQHLGICRASGEFKAIDTKHDFESNDDEVTIQMKNVLGIEHQNDHFVIHTGSPHYIEYRPHIDQMDLLAEARAIRYSTRFEEDGINVNFVEIKNNAVHMRTYERGVENETLSCGTGVTAVALSYGYLRADTSEVVVHTKGGVLRVSFETVGHGEFEEVKLTGPAQWVFDGSYQL
jgi:diaminopimelate epimerase